MRHKGSREQAVRAGLDYDGRQADRESRRRQARYGASTRLEGRREREGEGGRETRRGRERERQGRGRNVSPI